MRKTITVICSLLLCLTTLAQTLRVSGTVRDASGKTVVGAVVLLKGSTSVAAVSDGDGKYQISIPSGVKAPELTASCIGFKDQTIAVEGRAVIDFKLKEDAQLLEETVVIGYGAMRRSDLTGSVASVRIDSDEAANSSSLDQLLEGRASGVQVLADNSNPDSGVSIRIRGMSSFSGSNEPLYVVDGIIINGDSSAISPTSGVPNENEGAAESTNGLAGINPQDIQNIEILKDASATAIYGSLGANGVVLITTKQANSLKPSIQFNTGVSLSEKQSRMDVLSFDEHVRYLEMLKETGMSSAASALASIYANPEKHEGLQVFPVDWQDYVMRRAFSNNFYFSVAGKPKNYNYLFSIGAINDNGVIKKTDSHNYTIRLNIEKTVSSRLKLAFKSNMSYIYSNLTSGNGGGGRITGATSIIRSVLRTKPYTARNLDDEQAEEGEDELLMYGPDKWLNNFKNNSRRFRINPALKLDYKITDYLSFNSTIGGEFMSNERTKAKGYLLSQSAGNTAGVSTLVNLRYNWDNLLTFNKSWGRHTVTGTLGQSLSYRSDITESVSAWDLPQHKAEELDINNADPAYSSFLYSESMSQLLSGFVRVIYNYADRYVLTSTFRADGSSKFQGRNKWAYFPSFAFAWRINNEPWFDIPVVSLMKLRLGWGQVGNQAIKSYQTQMTYADSEIGNHNNLSGTDKGLYPSIINNPELRWETSEQVNIGLDLSLWKGRLALTVDAYNKDVKDLLQQKRIARDTGFATMFVNQGAIRNRGFEVSLETVPVKRRLFEWSLSGNISFNRNTLMSVGDDDTGVIYLTEDNPRKVNFFYGQALSSSISDPINIFIQGQSMGLFYGYKTDGIVQAGEEGPGFGETGARKKPGQLKYKDLDGNGYIDVNDRTIIGDPLPRFTYGFNTAFDFKRLSLKIRFDGAYDFDVFNYNNIDDMDTNQSTRNVRMRALTDVWSESNPGGKTLALGVYDADNRAKYSDYFVEDASYLRLSNVTLSYNIPLSGKVKSILKSVSIGLSASNLYTFTRYSGWNAAANSFGSNVNKMGIDLNTSPAVRSYTLNVKFSF